MKKRLREVRKFLKSKGVQAEVEHLPSGHLKIDLPGGKSLRAPVTPSDWRSDRNLLRDVRRVLS